MQQDRKYRAEYRAMTEKERDRAVEAMIAKFERLFAKIKSEVTR
jgi:hypothetical protein